MNITMEKALRTSLYTVLAIYGIHFFVLGFLVPPLDFDHLAGYYETAWRFWKTSSGLPHYNPFQCGGRSLGGDPQNFIFSPWTLAVPLLGAVWTIKIQMLTELAAGLYGLFLLCSFFQLEKTQRVASYFFFVAGGALISRFTTGHVTLGFYFLYPLFLALSYRFKTYRDLLSPSHIWYVLLFVYAGNYKPNFYIYGLPPLAFEVFFRALFTRSFVPLASFFIACVFSVGVNAIVLLPSQKYFTDFPRHDFDEWLPIPLHTYLLNLLFPLRTLPNHWYGPRFLQRHEYNLFLGPVILWLAWKGAAYFKDRFRPHFSAFLFASVLSVLIGFGSSTPSFSIIYPYTWFYNLWPGFHSVRVPTRFWILSAFLLTLLAARGTAFVQTRRQKQIFLFFGILPLLLSAIVNLSKTSFLSTETQWARDRFFPKTHTWVRNDIHSTLRYLRQGQGVLDCVSNMQFELNPLLRPGDSLLFETSAPAAVSLGWRNWNEIQVKIQSPHPVSVSLNLNPHPYWHFIGKGGVDTPRKGPLTILAKDGQAEGTLVFKQPMSIEGLITTLASLAVLFFYAVWVFWNTKKIRVIGLTGGVASGKSIVAEAFVREGIAVFNMDFIGRDLLTGDPKVIQGLTAICGKDILASDGSIDRMKVRVILFSDSQKKKQIESLLHPLIWKEFYRRAREAQKAGKATVICEAALHIESRRMERLDGLIVVLADTETRIERLMQRDHISREFAEEILRNQTSDEERQKHAQVTIRNEGSREEFFQRSIGLVKKLKQDGFI